jgi:hypothetical protein
MRSSKYSLLQAWSACDLKYLKSEVLVKFQGNVEMGTFSILKFDFDKFSVIHVIRDQLRSRATNDYALSSPPIAF